MGDGVEAGERDSGVKEVGDKGMEVGVGVEVGWGDSRARRVGDAEGEGTAVGVLIVQAARRKIKA